MFESSQLNVRVTTSMPGYPTYDKELTMLRYIEAHEKFALWDSTFNSKANYIISTYRDTPAQISMCEKLDVQQSAQSPQNPAFNHAELKLMYAQHKAAQLQHPKIES